MKLAAGDRVDITTGPFADFHGIVASVEPDSDKAIVALKFFGRYVPVKLDIDHVCKNAPEEPGRNH